MSHTVKNQAWQKPSNEESKPAEAGETEQKEGEEAKTSLETGIGVPSWTFKLEGKLLPVCLSFTILEISRCLTSTLRIA